MAKTFPALVPLRYGSVYCELCKRTIHAGQRVGWWTLKIFSVLFWVVIGILAAGAILFGLFLVVFTTGVADDWTHREWQVAIWATVLGVPAVVIGGLVWSLKAPKA